MSTTVLYVICNNCSKEFPSPIQYPEGSQIFQVGNVTTCPFCRGQTTCDRTIRRSA